MRAPSFARRAALLLAAGACSDPPAAPARPDPPPQAPRSGLVAAGGYWEGFNFLSVPSLGPLAGVWPRHTPTPWKPTDLDVAVHSRDPATWYVPEPFRAMHGTGCEPFQNPEPVNDVRPWDAGSHPVGTYDDMVFRCRNHVMTALKATGYGVIYLTPNAMVDFSAGEAVVRWAMSTLRTSGRDWVDLWVTPWDDNLQLPLDADLPDLQGPPRTAIHVRMAAGPKERTWFEAYHVDRFVATRLPVATTAGYESILRPVSTRRDTFELRLSRDRIRFGMRKGPSPNEGARSITWVDTPLAAGFTRGVVQFGHHSMHPLVDGGSGGTWHWDDFTIAPAVPFTIVTPKLHEGVRTRYVDAATAHRPVEFERPAPAGARLRFAGYGANVEVSFDGTTWERAARQHEALDVADRFHSYWTPVPPNVARVWFRASAPWLVRDVAIWSR